MDAMGRFLGSVKLTPVDLEKQAVIGDIMRGKEIRKLKGFLRQAIARGDEDNARNLTAQLKSLGHDVNASKKKGVRRNTLKLFGEQRQEMARESRNFDAYVRSLISPEDLRK
jgi:hypothetical protein